MNSLEYPIVNKSFNDSLHAFQFVATEWKISFIQLGGGVFSSNLKQVIYPNIQFGDVSFNSSVKQEGKSPEGFWTFAFVRDSNMIWRNYRVAPCSIIIYAPNSVINAVSSPGFEVQILSISEDEILRYCKKSESNFISEIEKLLVVKPDYDDWKTMVDLIITLMDKPPVKEPIHILKKLIPLVKSSKTNLIKISQSSRLKLLSTAEKYIQENIKEPILNTELAEFCKVSERTLLYAFKQRFGIGPKAFVKILKLNAVYYELIGNSSSLSISKTAKQYGFWHLGQFYTDYKSFFGELPSTTINNISSIP